MALVIKAFVSRKLTEDFNSRGWALELQSEFDPRMLDDTDGLAKSTDFLFQLANDLLDQQVSNSTPGHEHRGNGDSHRSKQNPDSGNGHGNGAYGRRNNGSRNGNGNGVTAKTNGNGRKERPITTAQINAIQKMATRLDTNGDAVALEDFNTPLAELTIKQASTLIDNLKRAIEAPTGQGVQS